MTTSRRPLDRGLSLFRLTGQEALPLAILIVACSSAGLAAPTSGQHEMPLGHSKVPMIRSWDQRTDEIIEDHPFEQNEYPFLDSKLSGTLTSLKEFDPSKTGETIYNLASDAYVKGKHIANDGKHPPITFSHPYVNYPSPRSDESNDTVIARYRILVPIFVPAVIKPTTTEKPIRYVSQTVTEMVPVKQMVPRVKEVVRAVPISRTTNPDYNDDSQVSSDIGDVIEHKGRHMPMVNHRFH